MSNCYGNISRLPMRIDKKNDRIYKWILQKDFFEDDNTHATILGGAKSIANLHKLMRLSEVFREHAHRELQTYAHIYL